MSAIPVHIILQGLLALVPINDADGTNQMQVLVLKTEDLPQGLPAEASQFAPCIVPHHPKLTVKATSSKACTDAGCDAVAPRCECTNLGRKEISIEIVPKPEPTKQRPPKRPNRSLPFNNEMAGDFSYVANLSELGQTLDSSYLGDSPPDRLLAKMTFPFERLTTCFFSTRTDDNVANVHPLSFRPLHADEAGDEKVVQAAAEMLIATAHVPDAVSQEVRIKLSDFGGANPKLITLQPTDGSYIIELENHRPKLSPDDLCEDGIGRDFALFYELATGHTAWSVRAIPHVKYTQWKSAGDLLPELCTEVLKKGKNPMSLPICPMGSFNP